MKLLIVGCGSLGSHVATIIATNASGLELECEITLMDPDTVSSRNLISQRFYSSDVGESKVSCLAERLGPLVKINAIEDWFSLKNLPKEKPDFIIDCTDNLEARKSIWTYAVSFGIPLLAACSSPGNYGYVYPTLVVGDINIDLNPFSRSYTAAPTQDEIPPCELAKYTSLSMQIALATTKAFFLLGYALDYTDALEKGEQGLVITAWQCDSNSHKIINQKVLQ